MAFKARHAKQGQTLGPVKIRNQIYIRQRRRIASRNGPKETKMHDSGSFQLRLVPTQRRDYMPFVHTLNFDTIGNPFQSGALAGSGEPSH